MILIRQVTALIISAGTRKPHGRGCLYFPDIQLGSNHLISFIKGGTHRVTQSESQVGFNAPVSYLHCGKQAQAVCELCIFEKRLFTWSTWFVHLWTQSLLAQRD